MRKISKFSIMLIILLIISFSFNIAGAVAENTAEPGSEQDPLVSKAYVDEKTTQYMDELSKSNAQIADLKAQLEASKTQIEELKTQIQSGSTGSPVNTVVNLEAGQQLLPGAGTEVILVSGKATAVAGKDGLLLDVTAAKTLAKGASIVLNHMMIASKDDGRGIKVSSKASAIVIGIFKTTEKATTDTTGNTTNTNTNNSSNTNKPTENKIVKGKVNVSSLRVRQQPGTDAKIVANLISGAIVEIIGTKNDWTNIKTSAGVKGWVLTKYITKQ